MRVLWIKSDFPVPADTGGKIRTLNLLKSLSTLCNVTFLSYIPVDHDERHVSEMAACGIECVAVVRNEEKKEGLRFYRRVLSNLLSPLPYVVRKYVCSEMAHRIMTMLHEKPVDVVICDFLEMAWCLKYIGRTPTVLFEHNVETLIWRRYHEVEQSVIKKLYFNYEKRRLERFERDTCSQVDRVLTVSDQDGELLCKEFGVSSYVTIATGVDTDYFCPMGPEVERRIVFCGSMDWMPNIDGFWWFYRKILPRIREEVPDVTFAVVGRRPGADIVEVGERDPSVIVSGTVDDVRPFVAGAQVYVVPLRVGGGTRIKIYEAMAMRKCVVSTSIGAEGLPVSNEVHIVLADGELAFAEQVAELLRNVNRRSRIADAGYGLVRERYSWKEAAVNLYKTLEDVADSR